MWKPGDIIPAEKVADLTGIEDHDPGEEGMYVSDDGVFWAVLQEDRSIKLLRTA